MTWRVNCRLFGLNPSRNLLRELREEIFSARTA
jgi:hypothetical protein